MEKPHTRQVVLFLIGLLALVLSACSAGAENTPDAPTATTPAVASPARTLPPPAVAAASSATPRSTAAPLASPTPRPTATRRPTEAPTAVPPTTEPTVEPTPVPPTATAVPPTPAPSPTPAPIYAEWLGYLNRFRDMAGVDPLGDQAALNLGSRLHSQYMVVNDTAISHKQDPSLPFYDPAGDQAARNGNVFATSMIEADYVWGINFWVSAPFHLVPMIAPRLERVGYGDYNEAGGNVSMAAVLDVRTERNSGTGLVEYPLMFPRDGSTTWIGRHNLFEWPDPLTSCPGYSRPTGPPFVIQIGDGTLTPAVGSVSVLMGNTPVEICVFDETSYHNSDVWAEKAGRLILNAQDAVVIMPRQPLIADQTYTVQVEANGKRHQWSFRTAASRPAE